MFSREGDCFFEVFPLLCCVAAFIKLVQDRRKILQLFMYFHSINNDCKTYIVFGKQRSTMIKENIEQLFGRDLKKVK